MAISMKRMSLTPVLAALLAAGASLVLSQSMRAENRSHAVPAAEAAVLAELPQAKILGSRLLSSTQAEVLVEFRGQISPVLLTLTGPNQWQQDVQATLMRTAQDLQQLIGDTGSDALQPNLTNQPIAFGQGSLLEQTQASSVLLPAADSQQETTRALSSSGRRNPFEPLNVIPTPPPQSSPTLNPKGDVSVPAPELPIVPGVTPREGLVNPPNPDLSPIPAPVVPDGTDIGLPPIPAPAPSPTATPDPATFARTVAINGIIKIDNESFALVSAQGKVPAIVQPGQPYETADVARISSREREVILTEGGVFVEKGLAGSTNVIKQTGTTPATGSPAGSSQAPAAK